MAPPDHEPIRRIAEELFGLGGKVSRLPGEHDRNFLLTDPGSGAGTHVLKLCPGERRPILDMSVNALEHVANASLLLPHPVPLRAPHATDGSPYLAPVSVSGRGHVAAALTWVPGRPLAQIPWSARFLEDVGSLLAALDNALVDFDHVALDRPFPWKLERGLDTVEAHMAFVPSGRKPRVAGIMSRVARWLEGLKDKLPIGVIHNDANDYNVVVSENGEGEERVGLIDFGDMVRGWRIAELGVAAAYMMMDRPDPVAAACALVRGYRGRLPLTEAECGALLPLAALRLCLSVSIQGRQMREQTDNEYLSVSQEPAWRLLETLDGADWQVAEARIRHAAGHAPSAGADAVLQWIRANPTLVSPPVEAHHLDRPVLVDMSVESLTLPHPDDAPNGPALDAWVDDVVARQGGSVGVGRYGEARLVYDAPDFAEDADPVPEGRTIHMGVDLFLPAGTPVLATLEGTVSGVVDNAGDLDYGPTVVIRHEPGGVVPFYTLYGHLSRETLDHLEPGSPVDAGDVIGWLGDRSVNGGWTPHLHLQLITPTPHGPEPEPHRLHGFRGVARPGVFPVWQGLYPNPGLLTGLPDGPLTETATRPDRTGLLAARRAAHLGPSLTTSYEEPLHIVRGLGAWLYDAEGRRYLDTVNNVAHVGHANRRVVEAMMRQSRVLNTNTRYLHDELPALCEELTALMPPSLEVVYLVCSGSEANELALRLARAHTGRRGVVTVEGAYHGNTGGLIDISPYKLRGAGGRPPEGHVAVARAPDPYRDGSTGAVLAEDVARCLDALADGAAAFICESIASCAGQIEPPPGYLINAFGAARARGAVCIADEVQVGFGRVGEAFWGFELQGVVPDIVTLGKPMGNGHPVGAVITTRDIAASFDDGMEYFNTFGGNPVSCATARAVLAEIEERELREHARRVGDELREGLRTTLAPFPVVGDVRGRGLFLGIELVEDRETKAPAPGAAHAVVERMKERRILTSRDGPHRNVLKIKPPMVFSREDAGRLIDSLRATLIDVGPPPSA